MSRRVACHQQGEVDLRRRGIAYLCLAKRFSRGDSGSLLPVAFLAHATARVLEHGAFIKPNTLRAAVAVFCYMRPLRFRVPRSLFCVLENTHLCARHRQELISETGIDAALSKKWQVVLAVPKGTSEESGESRCLFWFSFERGGMAVSF